MKTYIVAWYYRPEDDLQISVIKAEDEVDALCATTGLHDSIEAAKEDYPEGLATLDHYKSALEDFELTVQVVEFNPPA